ncbi:MAG: hypothetical protein ACOVMR_08605, partial [Flavobacteriales bacterium]
SSTFFILSSIRKFFTLGYDTFYGVLRKKVAVLQLMLEKEWLAPEELGVWGSELGIGRFGGREEIGK